jgi:glycosyltransferase involved in cell wall biosynthesis
MYTKDKTINNCKSGINKPRVSIGMPVFNSEEYIEEAFDSILNQTFPDFELIVSDNASTDRTQQICLDYAFKDSRVRYYRNKKNLGAPTNYNRVFELSSSEFFKWAAYDDVLAPDFLKKCVAVLDKDQSIVGCYCETGRIDKDGNFLGYYNEDSLRNISSKKPHQRFRALLDMYYITTPFHGVYRRSLFAQTQRHGSYIGADRNLVAELSLLGRIYKIPETLFFWREHASSYTSIFYGRVRENTLDRILKEMSWWSKEGGTYFPHWKNCVEYFRSVKRIPLRPYERVLCYGQIFDWILREGRRFLLKDMVLFLLQHSHLARTILKHTRAILTPKTKSKLLYLVDID